MPIIICILDEKISPTATPPPVDPPGPGNFTINPPVRPTVPPPGNFTINPSVRPTVPPPGNFTINPSVRPTVPPPGNFTINPPVRPTVRPSVRPTRRPPMRPTPTVRPSVCPTVPPRPPRPTDRPPRPSPTDRPPRPSPTDRPPRPSPTDRPPRPSPTDRPPRPSPTDRPPRPSPTDSPFSTDYPSSTPLVSPPPVSCASGSIRLRNGPSPYSGLVEICRFNTWGTVCSNSWDRREALVACRQLGYPGTGLSLKSSFNLLFLYYLASKALRFYNRTRGPIHYTNMQCHGSETSLLDCPLQQTNQNYFCSSGGNAGVECSGK